MRGISGLPKHLVEQVALDLHRLLNGMTGVRVIHWTTFAVNGSLDEITRLAASGATLVADAERRSATGQSAHWGGFGHRQTVIDCDCRKCGICVDAEGDPQDDRDRNQHGAHCRRTDQRHNCCRADN